MSLLVYVLSEQATNLVGSVPKLAGKFNQVVDAFLLKMLWCFVKGRSNVENINVFSTLIDPLVVQNMRRRILL
jgi:hypothetical protein